MANIKPGGLGGEASSPSALFSVSWSIATFRELPSTQDQAIAAAQKGAPTRSAFIAERQIAGRGRAGREWRAPEGNLNFSALLRCGGIMPVPAQWSLAASVALHDAVAAFLPRSAPLTLKWPNDLLLGGAKLAGILIDSALTQEGRLDWVVIGVGVNLAQAPHLPDRATTCLAAHGAVAAPVDLAARLMTALDQWSDRDLAAIRTAWLARAHPPGTRLRVHAGPRVIQGAFETLAPDGSLILQGHPPLSSGEAFLEPTHAAGG